ncbi:hypothetical protein HN51_052789 [Arachis hypogaea]|uniref:BHLH domain-containing protein n=2 Tax=Arachis hypogaea TaxID=3818 RepID=A0A445C9C8_ARAHY|nr:transcription factor bHLH96 [Arachis hypogaea]XP_025667574.1 transcription factor bHLH96 [Arachis hypogaea]QHN94220.1 Transcription factor [Arachis hypogaea]RYR47529.1 hypothetical protein Ahy_A07g033464 isoform A [Arachis hypogaea]RYR47530.1 hypothetical protein Ahy_A07g033464 isoform B [Arachis hypogaea]
MALEAVVFPQDPLFSYASSTTTTKDYFYSSFLGSHHHDLIGIINNNIIQQNQATNNSDSSSPPSNNDHWDHSHYATSSSSPDCCAATVDQPSVPTTTGRRKRRRTKTTKNKEDIENQRMTHIAVERNRRKQMNDYLAVLRSLMPPSYVQRGDQASIIGGAINFVKELEQLLQSMEGQKKPNHHDTTAAGGAAGMNSSGQSSPFGEFFAFPQYTTRGHHQGNNNATTMAAEQQQKQWAPAVADIEVTMVDSHANLKILSKKRHGQLMKMVVGLQSLSLTILHLNVTTLHDFVLYSVSVKAEDGCQLNTVDEIAAAVNQLLCAVQQEASSFNEIN